jgi:hypothetical protein
MDQEVKDFSFISEKSLMETIEKQRRNRLSDAIGDYITDESIPPEKIYSEILQEIDDWIFYFQKNTDRVKALRDLISRS